MNSASYASAASAVIVGAGVIGIEYASMFAALGVKVTIVEKRPRLLEVTAEPGFQDRVVELRQQLIEDEERLARQGGVSE